MRKRHMRALTVRALGLASAALLLAACSSQGQPGGTPTEGEDGLTPVTVAEVQGLPAEYLTFGIAEGYFEEQGLDVEVRAGAGGAANMPQVVSGDAQFAGSNVVSVMLGVQQGLDVTMVGPGTFGGDETGHGYQNVMVTDPQIQSMADLEGATIAINTLQNIDEVLIRASLRENGVDDSTVELVEMPFPDMEAALQGGQVDAVRIIEPFATIAEEGGARFLDGGTTAAVQPSLQIGSYVTSGQFAEENPEAVEGFRAGLAATAERVTEDPQALRDWLVENSDTPQAVVDAMVLPDYTDSVDVASLETLGDLMVEFGFAEEVPPVEDYVLQD
ncbi:ABC transporter substrate-binding protein [Georgenia alba]|uniref:ABC transporter substrate-binding protein n=1 Tax=Georgenia alba TaxID=2233858 RepID=A0ABW2Q9F7_9MICO